MKRFNRLISSKKYKATMDIISKKEKDRIYCCHGYEHLFSVARISSLIVCEKRLNVDKELIYVTSFLHDIGRAFEPELPHDLAGADFAREIMPEYGFSNEEIKLVTDTILNHRGRADLEKPTNLMSVIKLADKLSRNCFLCAAKDSCKWTNEEKNYEVFY
ncbi:HDIG domain-containing protein [Acetitomaculum ruminis DSM 5522]|uniref:HDIG domain-containing protein n=1 Tax=Acetitomaculum ruminis DSM 5522 TaxID=1120918 RepID=A0A1I0XV39_9FIRM|nr:HD domain-containing protein [Acetitomaculum ruminis]SFB04048.1 HDIG domain-containing protein [Acetitomaculum ruminis DSM 5522]